MTCLMEILIYEAVRMEVFLKTFQAHDMDMLKTYYKKAII